MILSQTDGTRVITLFEHSPALTNHNSWIGVYGALVKPFGLLRLLALGLGLGLSLGQELYLDHRWWWGRLLAQHGGHRNDSFGLSGPEKPAEGEEEGHPKDYSYWDVEVKHCIFLFFFLGA